MALAATMQNEAEGVSQRVTIQPVVWKLVFLRDVEKELHAEIDYISRRLHLASGAKHSDPAGRLYALYEGLLARDEVKWAHDGVPGSYFSRLKSLVRHLIGHLEAKLDEVDAPMAEGEMPEAAIRRGERWLRAGDRSREGYASLKELTGDLRRLLRMREEFYQSPTLSQENVAEGIKRLRSDYCAQGFRAALHKLLPMPVGPRKAIIRVPPPIVLGEGGPDGTAECIMDEIRVRLQRTLDEINRDLAANRRMPTYSNPFHPTSAG